MDWIEIRKGDWDISQPPSQQDFLLIASETLESGIAVHKPIVMFKYVDEYSGWRLGLSWRISGDSKL